MKFKALTLQDENAQRVYDRYINSMKNTLKPISENDRNELLMEFNSHIYEHLQVHKSEGEMNALLDILDKLGTPEEVLQPLVADKMLEKATRTFNPKDVFKAIVLNISNGISFVIFAILYLFLLVFGLVIVLEIMFPSKVGLYTKDGEFVFLGYPGNTEGMTEVLGAWLIPVMVVAIIVFYFVVTLLLRLRRLINKKS